MNQIRILIPRPNHPVTKSSIVCKYIINYAIYYSIDPVVEWEHRPRQTQWPTPYNYSVSLHSPHRYIIILISSIPLINISIILETLQI